MLFSYSKYKNIPLYELALQATFVDEIPKEGQRKGCGLNIGGLLLHNCAINYEMQILDNCSNRQINFYLPIFNLKVITRHNEERGDVSRFPIYIDFGDNLAVDTIVDMKQREAGSPDESVMLFEEKVTELKKIRIIIKRTLYIHIYIYLDKETDTISENVEFNLMINSFYPQAYWESIGVYAHYLVETKTYSN